MPEVAAHLRGMTWDHSRGYDPLVVASELFSRSHPDTYITWEKRSLNKFEQTPLSVLAEQYDLIVIDHPHVGEATESGCLLALDDVIDSDILELIAAGSLGKSYESYNWKGHQWALPIDAAAQVAARREDVTDALMRTWEEVIDTAENMRVLWPLKPVHALMSFFTLAANLGTPCRVLGPELISLHEAERVFESMIRLVQHLPESCYAMDPIDTCEALAAGEADACPLLYGYVSYTQDGFRPHRVLFDNIPRLGNDRRGSTLGGTGIAVSKASRHLSLASAFAAQIAAPDWQSSVIIDHGGQPAHRTAWIDARNNQMTSNFFANSLATLDSAWMRPRFAGYINFQYQAGEIVTSVLQRRIAIAQAVAQLNEQFAAAQLN